MNETANEAGARPGPGEDTSGQAGQKFRQESTQERLNKSKLRMEKRGGKLEAAREKLANQKPPKRPGPVKRVGRAAGRGCMAMSTVSSFKWSRITWAPRALTALKWWARPPCGAGRGL